MPIARAIMFPETSASSGTWDFSNVRQEAGNLVLRRRQRVTCFEQETHAAGADEATLVVLKDRPPALQSFTAIGSTIRRVTAILEDHVWRLLQGRLEIKESSLIDQQWDA